MLAVMGSKVAPRKTQPSLTVAKRFRCLVLDVWATTINNGTNEPSPKRGYLQSHTVIIVNALWEEMTGDRGWVEYGGWSSPRIHGPAYCGKTQAIDYELIALPPNNLL